MAGKTTRMSKIKQVLQLHLSGLSNRSIAVKLALYKGTVNEYIRKVKAFGFDIGALLAMEDLELEQKFSAGNPAYLQERYHVFKDKLPYFEKELGRRHVKKRTLWEEYIGEYPNGYRYTQFCHHLKQMLVARRPSAILEHTPGMELHVDFCGDTMSYVDRQTGEIIKVQVFIACFPHSDYTFAMAVPSQTTDDFLHALRWLWNILEEVPKCWFPTI